MVWLQISCHYEIFSWFVIIFSGFPYIDGCYFISLSSSTKAHFKMLEGKAVVRETDMPDALRNHAMELAYQALDLHEVSDYQSIAHYIKKVCNG